MSGPMAKRPAPIPSVPVFRGPRSAGVVRAERNDDMSFQANGELVPAGGGDNIPLIREALTIGRRDTCDICLRFPNVSGVHAELTFRNGYWYLRDRNSTNGIKVNGVRVLEKMLHPRDRITIG